jgi:transposase-like protein
MTPPAQRSAPVNRGPSIRQPDPHIIRQLYTENGHTVSEIAVRLSISRAQVTAALKSAGIGWRSSRKRCPVDDDCLRRMVLDGAANPTTLARRYGVARNTAARWLAEAGLLDKDPAIDEHRLRQLYVDQQLTTREVAEALGVNKTKILLALAAAGIVARPREMKRPRPTASSVTADAVIALYSEPGMTMRKAAAHFEVSIDCISRRLIELGIPRPDQAESRRRAPSAELRNQAAELYRTGNTIQAVAAKLDVSATTVSTALHAARTPIRAGGRRQPHEHHPDLLVELYTDPDIVTLLHYWNIEVPTASQLQDPDLFDVRPRQPVCTQPLSDLYSGIGLSIHHLALLFGVSDATIRRRLIASGIQPRSATQPCPWNQRRRPPRPGLAFGPVRVTERE